LVDHILKFLSSIPSPAKEKQREREREEEEKEKILRRIQKRVRQLWSQKIRQLWA
jgi:hypothetical protein